MIFMSTYIETLKKPNGDQVLPRTKARAVALDSGDDAESVFESIKRLTSSLVASGTEITADMANADDTKDLNSINYLESGIYYCRENNTAKLLQNCPTTHAFKMEVYSLTSQYSGTNYPWMCKIRRIITISGTEYYQYASSESRDENNNVQYTFAKWKKTVTIDADNTDLQLVKNSDDINIASDGSMTLNDSVASAGTYNKVTVNSKGLVTGGTNPNTLGDYGIIDAYTKSESNSKVYEIFDFLSYIHPNDILVVPKGTTRISGGSYTSTNYAIACLPDSVETIGDSAFIGCKNLCRINMPTMLRSIGDSAFHACINLTDEIAIPDGVKSIGDSAFYNCNISGLSLPNSLETIGDEAFSNCENLCCVTMPARLTSMSIGNKAFYKCTRLTGEIILPNGTQSVGNDAFRDCKITGLTLQDGLKTIGDYAFANCNDIYSENLRIPDSVTSLGTNAFANCNYIEKVTIGAGIESILASTFCNCNRLQYVEFQDPLETKVCLKSIGAGAFTGCTSLSEIAIPSPVEKLDNYAFNDCTSLSRVELPSTLTEIGVGTFSNCTALSEIVFNGLSRDWFNVKKGDYWYSGTQVSTITCNDKTIDVTKNSEDE